MSPTFFRDACCRVAEARVVAKAEQSLSKMLDAGVDGDEGECRGERRGEGRAVAAQDAGCGR